jgi:hypothetical protein
MELNWEIFKNLFSQNLNLLFLLGPASIIRISASQLVTPAEPHPRLIFALGNLIKYFLQKFSF